MMSRACRGFLASCLALLAVPLLAQQTGEIHGKVTATDGSVLPGSGGRGSLHDPSRAPPDGHGRQRRVSPAGAAPRRLHREVRPRGHAERHAQSRGPARPGYGGRRQARRLRDRGVGHGDGRDVPARQGLRDHRERFVGGSRSPACPSAQDYRDLQKLIPGVQYTQDQTRGPSAGGSGQDNVYQFDGVNVTLPLFGTLSAEPASHDIAQVTVVKGGARAVDFDRSGGFAIDSVSKSGTSRYSGQVSYQFQSCGHVRGPRQRDPIPLRAGPKLDQRQPRRARSSRTGSTSTAPTTGPRNRGTTASNLYGELPSYDSTRNEGFGKLTFTPTHSTLFNFSYRDSKRVDESDLFLANASATTGSGNEARLKIGTADGSWVINTRSHLSFKYTHFTNLTQGRPDHVADVDISTAVGHQARHRQPRHPGPSDRARAHRRPGRLQRLRPAPHRPLRLRPERRARGRGHGGLRHALRQRRLLPRRRADRATT